MNAILLALYGPNSFAYKESKYNSYGQYLKAFTNTKDGTYYTYIEIEFILDKSSNNRFLVKREWNGSKLRVDEKVVVSKNGEYDPFLTESWEMYARYFYSSFPMTRTSKCWVNSRSDT